MLSRMMGAQQSKVTFKSIPHYPDLVIKEAPCNVNATWEDFLRSFGVDLKKVAPGYNFMVRSRKGLCYLSDTIEHISSKYVQKYRMLVTIEQELVQAKPRQRRRRKRLQPIVLPNIVPPTPMAESVPEESELRATFPPFSSFRYQGNMNFQTRIEKIEDYNVIQKSSVIWPEFAVPESPYTQCPQCPMLCFSMTDPEFIL